ncbi:hypothetical protein FRC08_012572 [Ceratobasidium sp. 394]|nr:hypothetical protein FRC08_012572 [Ceratobasidium sp. 394]
MVVIEGEDADAAMPGRQEGREFNRGDECTGEDAVDVDAETKVGIVFERKTSQRRRDGGQAQRRGRTKAAIPAAKKGTGTRNRKLAGERDDASKVVVVAEVEAKSNCDAEMVGIEPEGMRE